MDYTGCLLQALMTLGVQAPVWHGSPPPATAGDITLALLSANMPENPEVGSLNVLEIQHAYEAVMMNVLKERATALARQTTEQAITIGLTSSVLGSPHTYPSTREGQSDISGLAQRANIDSTGGKLWCADADNVWQRRDHTAEQIIQLGREMITWVEQHRDSYEATLAQIQAATTVAEVQAIIDGM